MSESMKELRIRVEKEGVDGKTRRMIEKRIHSREQRSQVLTEEIIWYRNLLKNFDTSTYLGQKKSW